jgi:hypothetical protein
MCPADAVVGLNWRRISFAEDASARVSLAPGYPVRLTISWGTNPLGSVSRARIVRSVIAPAPWWCAIGMPLIAAMSPASPLHCA